MRGATSFDAKGARYTHRDGLCLSEVLIEDYKLDVNTATQDATSAPIASLLQDGHAEPARAERRVLDRRDAVRGRSRARSSAW